jgi:hypothetical protein
LADSTSFDQIAPQIPGPSPTTTIPEVPEEEITLFCRTALKHESRKTPEKRESEIVLETTSMFETFVVRNPV